MPERNTSCRIVKLSLFSASVLVNGTISVVAERIFVSSISGSSVGSIILLFFLCGISTFVGFSFFVLFRIVINFKGIALFVKLLATDFDVGAYVVISGVDEVTNSSEDVLVEETRSMDVFPSSVSKIPLRLLYAILFSVFRVEVIKICIF